jgi:hypothetical protein
VIPAPEMKWKSFRNLRFRPAKPALGNGRLQRQVARACIVAGTPIVSSSTFYAWAYAGKKLRGEPVSWGHRSSVKRILRTIATPVGRANTIGRPLLWKLNDDVAARWR